MDVQDMADLICARDAYKAMNKSLHGEEMVLGFHEGQLGALGRIFRVIERNVSERWRKDDDGAVRMMDAISLSPEERAKILLDESRHKLNGEKGIKMEKYKFRKELKEAVLIGRINGEASVIIDGVERKAKCHVMGKVGAKGIPCLVSEDDNRENLRYTVEAISFDNGGEKSNWICVRPILLEQAVEYFLESHQLENMLGDYEHVIRTTTATAGKCRPDFQVDGTWIEMRILGRNARKSQEFDGRSLTLPIRQVEKYFRQLSVMKKRNERMILLLAFLADREEKQISFKGIANAEIKKAVENGVEVWTAELQVDIEGISLLSYHDITDKILDN